jgi:hypothetical protein
MSLSPVPSPAVVDVLTDIQRVLQEANDNVRDQHVVSKVVLKRFAARQGPHKGLIVPFSLDYPDGRHRPRGADGCGKIDNFVPAASRSLEMLWKQTEDKLPEAFKHLESPSPFAEERHLSLIKDAIALHYVRSPPVKEMHFKVFEDALAHTRELMLTEGIELLDRGFHDKHGRIPVDRDERLAFIKKLHQDLVEAANKGVMFRSRIEELFTKSRTILSRFGVEVITPAEGEFLIGDVPALTVRHGEMAVGVQSGIALGDANTVIMPLSPKHLVALGPANLSGTIPKIEVNRLNAMQVQAAEKYVYFRPGSGLESSVQSMLPLRKLLRSQRTAA